MQPLNNYEQKLDAKPGRLLGLKHYGNEAAAIRTEKCNDAVHLVYPTKLEQQATLFLDGFCGDSLYAIKANPHPSVIAFLWETGIRKFEIASLREAQYLSELLPQAELYFMHPIKSRQAIRAAYECGVRNFAFDSQEELKKIETETGKANDLTLFLRLKVDQDSALHPLSGKFGATVQEAPLLLQRADQIAHKMGITFHVGSQCMDPRDYRSALHKVATLLQQSTIEVDQLDIGGGFPVHYPGMHPVDLVDYFSEIQQALQEFHLTDLDILCEPGRALVAEAGAIAVRVEMRKGQILYLNDGTYGTLFDAGIPGWSYPLETIKLASTNRSAKTSLFKLFGPTCDSLDVMEGPFELDDEIGEGDWILFQNLGAYGYAMQTRFNGFYSETTVAIEED